MKNYKLFLAGLGLAAAAQVGCATTARSSTSSQVAAQGTCEASSQNMRPQWKTAAVRTAPSDVLFRPDVKGTDARHEVATRTFRPGVHEVNVAAASCIEPGHRTY